MNRRPDPSGSGAPPETQCRRGGAAFGLSMVVLLKHTKNKPGTRPDTGSPASRCPGAANRYKRHAALVSARNARNTHPRGALRHGSKSGQAGQNDRGAGDTGKGLRLPDNARIRRC